VMLDWSAMRYSTFAILLLLLGGSSHAQPSQGVPADASGPVSLPDISQSPPIQQPLPEYDIQAAGRLQEETLEEGKPFTYAVTLSWEGNQGWYSLKDPDVDWPKGIRQLEVSTQSRSVAGESGPLGTKSYRYLLVADKADEYELPTIAVEVVAPGVETPVTVEALGSKLRVDPHKASLEEKTGSAVRENWPVLLGVTLVAVVGLVVYFLQRGRSKPEEPLPDPWEPVDRDLKNAEALRLSGSGRDYYGALEKAIRNALSVAGIDAKDSLFQQGDSQGLPEETVEDLQSLTKEIAERKYRPDRPRPEEMDRSLREAKSVLRSLKESVEKRGSTA
jgi:oxygen tolerance protein BatD